MFDNPLVTVIIPTYKRSNYIERAVDSVINQTYRNLEILIIDDNEPESDYRIKTMTALSKYENDKRVKYIQTKGAIGGGAARNLGIGECTGEYVAFLDDDDRFLPEKIELQLQFMLEYNFDLSYQDVQWFDEHERLVELRKMDRVKEFSKEGLLRAHITYALSPTSIYMIKRSELIKTEGFGEVKRGQDFILMLRCIENGMRIGYMPGVYVVQYLHEGERISTGKQFVDAQTEIYRLMKRYTSILSKKENRYVDFRYYCVCAFASYRGKYVLEAIKYGLLAFLTSPYDCFTETRRFFRRNVN